MSRYIIGIDLGTTNSAPGVCRLDCVERQGRRAGREIRRFPSSSQPTRWPSGRCFLHSCTSRPRRSFPQARSSCRGSRLRRGWSGRSREHGAKVPGRLVGSAKSWLSHQGVDRRSPILPWSAPEDVTRVSPVDASKAFLEHLRDAWNARKTGKAAADRLENQEIFLTVPASFDAGRAS